MVNLSIRIDMITIDMYNLCAYNTRIIHTHKELSVEKVKESTRRLNIIVSEPLHNQLNEMLDKKEETKSDFVRIALEHEIERRKVARLEKAAAELSSLYETDEELLVFSSLEGEDFL